MMSSKRPTSLRNVGVAATVRSASVATTPSDSRGVSFSPAPKASDVAVRRSAYSSACRLFEKYCSRSSL
jgi:hypothetical protein